MGNENSCVSIVNAHLLSLGLWPIARLEIGITQLAMTTEPSSRTAGSKKTQDWYVMSLSPKSHFLIYLLLEQSRKERSKWIHLGVYVFLLYCTGTEMTH